MTQRESRLSQRIQKALRAEGYFCFKVHGTEMVMSGLPDIIVCAKGRFVGLETKHPEERNNTSVRQDFVHELIRGAQGHVEVVCSPQEALDAVARALES